MNIVKVYFNGNVTCTSTQLYANREHISNVHKLWNAMNAYDRRRFYCSV